MWPIISGTLFFKIFGGLSERWVSLVKICIYFCQILEVLSFLKQDQHIWSLRNLGDLKRKCELVLESLMRVSMIHSQGRFFFPPVGSKVRTIKFLCYFLLWGKFTLWFPIMPFAVPVFWDQPSDKGSLWSWCWKLHANGLGALSLRQNWLQYWLPSVDSCFPFSFGFLPNPFSSSSPFSHYSSSSSSATISMILSNIIIFLNTHYV